jgi:membrane-associated phospholipid phosphatase
MKKLTLLGLGLWGLTQGCAAGSAWGTASDWLATGLPTLAAAYTYQDRDADGARQLAWTLGATVGSTMILKSQISEMRPDRSNDQSFPSGHTAVAFASARYLDKRYPGQVSPYLLYGAAGLTALARVQADKHYWKDTLAGGALGYAFSEYFTETQAGGRVSLLPAPSGLTVAWQRPW